MALRSTLSSILTRLQYLDMEDGFVLEVAAVFGSGFSLISRNWTKYDLIEPLKTNGKIPLTESPAAFELIKLGIWSQACAGEYFSTFGSGSSAVHPSIISYVQFTGSFSLAFCRLFKTDHLLLLVFGSFSAAPEQYGRQ